MFTGTRPVIRELAFSRINLSIDFRFLIDFSRLSTEFMWKVRGNETFVAHPVTFVFVLASFAEEIYARAPFETINRIDN